MKPTFRQVYSLIRRHSELIGGTAEIVDASVRVARTHPGGWAPQAIAIVSFERGLPCPLWYQSVNEGWIELSDIAANRGQHWFMEVINGGVGAIWAS